MSANAKKPDRPHTLPAQQLYLSHLAPSLQRYSHDIKEQQATVQAENVELLERVMQQRRSIESLVKGLENAVSDLDASVASLHGGDVDIDGLRDEVKDVEDGMQMAA